MPEDARLAVWLDDGRRVSFALRDYAHIDHGYAATVHKSQGITVDRAHVLASGQMDRHAAYVGLTRHRDSVQLHWSVDEFGGREWLARVLGRERAKDTSLDYGPAGTGGEPEIPAGSPDSLRAYAERRGLAPESEIVVVQPAERPLPALGQTLRARLSQGRGEKRDPLAAARRDVELDRLRRGLEAGADPLSQARADAERLRAEDRPAPGTLDAAAANFQRAWGEAQEYRTRFGRALPEQEQALDRAEDALERVLPRGAEVLSEALEAGRVRPAERVKPGRLREAARERQEAHARSVEYRRGSEAIGAALQELERGWSGTAPQRERHAALVRRQWAGAREAVADEGLMAALERTAPQAAAQARDLAAQPEAAVDQRVRAQARQLESARQQVRVPRQSRGMSMGM